jgi:hypothetical protein
MALEGDLSEFTLIDIIQLVQLSKKTGVVELRGRRSSQIIEGSLYFRDGKILGAESPDLAPLDAVYTFFTLESGPFVFRDNLTITTPTINVSNEVIIMEGIMRQDAWATIQQFVPNLHIVPRLVPNPSSGSSEINLEPDEWRILTMVNGKNSVAQIAQRSGLGEFRTCEIIAQLFQNGLIDRRNTQIGEVLAPEFERIAGEFVGSGAPELLQEAYRQANIHDPQSATGDQLLAVADHFERGASVLIGAERAQAAASQLRTRAQESLG